MSWKLVKLSDICEINIGKTPARAKSAYWGKGYPWLSIADMNQGRYISSTKEEITNLGVKESGIKLVPKGTVLFSFKLSIGKIGITQRDMYTNEAIAALPIKDRNCLYEEYLIYALTRIDAGKTTDRAVMGATLNKKKLAELEIPLPSLEEQKRITSILEKADVIRRKRQQVIDLTDQLLRSAFLDMFGDPVKNQKGWKKIKLGELCNIVRGGSPRPIQDYLGGTIPWVKIGDATKGNDIYIESTKEKIIESGLSKTRLMQPGALIFANCGVSLGFARILKIAGCIHDGWLALEINDKRLNQIFLLKALNQITKYFQMTAPDGTQPNLNTTIMKNFELILPPIELQKKFEKLVHKVNATRHRNTVAYETANDAFNALTQQAFRGELIKQTKAA